MFTAIRSCLDKVVAPWGDFAIFICILKAFLSAFKVVSFKKFIFSHPCPFYLFSSVFTNSTEYFYSLREEDRIDSSQ